MSLLIGDLRPRTGVDQARDGGGRDDRLGDCRVRDGDVESARRCKQEKQQLLAIERALSHGCLLGFGRGMTRAPPETRAGLADRQQ